MQSDVVTCRPFLNGDFWRITRRSNRLTEHSRKRCRSRDAIAKRSETRRIKDETFYDAVIKNADVGRT